MSLSVFHSFTKSMKSFVAALYLLENMISQVRSPLVTQLLFLLSFISSQI